MTSLVTPLLPLLATAVTGYPGALCNVTYQLASPCQAVLDSLAEQISLWDNSTSCPGNCDQRHFLPDQVVNRSQHHYRVLASVLSYCISLSLSFLFGFLLNK